MIKISEKLIVPPDDLIKIHDPIWGYYDVKFKYDKSNINEMLIGGKKL